MARKIFEVGDVLPATTQLRIGWVDDISHIYIDGGIYSQNGSFALVETSVTRDIYINNTMIFVGDFTYAFVPPYTNYNDDHPYIDIDTSTWDKSRRTISSVSPGIDMFTWEDLNPPQGFSITFEENGGTTISDIEDATELPNPLPIPTKENHTFLGWYYDSAFTQIANAGDTIESNVTLYAGWRTTMQTSIRIYNGTTWFTLDGFSSYDCLNSLTYVNAPERTIGGTIPNLSSIPTFIVTTLFITYKLMPYQTYKDFINHINNKVEFVIEYFDVDTGLMKTKKFYLAPQSQRELFYARRGGVRSIDGILNITLEFISTNNEV